MDGYRKDPFYVYAHFNLVHELLKLKLPLIMTKTILWIHKNHEKWNMYMSLTSFVQFPQHKRCQVSGGINFLIGEWRLALWCFVYVLVSRSITIDNILHKVQSFLLIQAPNFWCQWLNFMYLTKRSKYIANSIWKTRSRF